MWSMAVGIKKEVFLKRAVVFFFYWDSILKTKELLTMEAKTGDQFTKCMQDEDNLVDFAKLLAQ